MENSEYIKSLEDRIKKLEDFIATIKICNHDSVSFTNCQIQGVGLEKCKNVQITDVTTQGFGFTAYSAKIENANIHNFENKSRKTKICNSKIDSKE